jgi:hypothetical protein
LALQLTIFPLTVAVATCSSLSFGAKKLATLERLKLVAFTSTELISVFWKSDVGKNDVYRSFSILKINDEDDPEAEHLFYFISELPEANLASRPASSDAHEEPGIVLSWILLWVVLNGTPLTIALFILSEAFGTRRWRIKQLMTRS